VFGVNVGDGGCIFFWMIAEDFEGEGRGNVLLFLYDHAFCLSC